MRTQNEEYLICENMLFNERGESFKVKYYRVETPSQLDTDKMIYAVCIRKHIGDELVEAVNINLTDSFEHANFIIHYLAKHSVTAISAVEVIDNIYDLYLK